MANSKKSNKYYCLHNNGTKSENEMFLRDLPEPKRKKFDHKMRYRLIEKTEKDGSESITAIFSLNTLSECYSITKGRDIYDYTGIISPLIHTGGKIYTFSEYCEINRK